MRKITEFRYVKMYKLEGWEVFVFKVISHNQDTVDPLE